MEDIKSELVFPTSMSETLFNLDLLECGGELLINRKGCSLIVEGKLQALEQSVIPKKAMFGGPYSNSCGNNNGNSFSPNMTITLLDELNNDSSFNLGNLWQVDGQTYQDGTGLQLGMEMGSMSGSTQPLALFGEETGNMSDANNDILKSTFPHSESFSKEIAYSTTSPLPHQSRSSHGSSGSDMRKRKGSIANLSDMDIDEEDEKSQKLNYEFEEVEGKKYTRQNHSEIEKRRRDKMNSYITELAAMIPMCCAMDRKLDKLTVLRMAVQHMKTLRGAASVPSEISHKPDFLSDEELKHLILKSADGFLFVVSCDRGRILFASESVRNILHFKQPELIGQSLFDFIHPKDVAKVKEQLLSSDMSPRERFIDAKTMMPVRTELPQKQSQLCSGAHRSFFCRMKTGSRKEMNEPKIEVDAETYTRRRKNDRRHFSIIHCSGYIKSWSRSKMGIEDDHEAEMDACDLSCLVAVGLPRPSHRLQQQTMLHDQAAKSDVRVRPIEFVSRHTVDGKFTFVDQRVTAILGYLPQELLGTSIYEYYHFVDINHISDAHRKSLKSREQTTTQPYRLKAKDGNFVKLKSRLHGFVNPWTKEVEYIVCKNTVFKGLIDCHGNSAPATQEVTSSGQCFDDDSLKLTMKEKIEQPMPSPMTTEVPHSASVQHGGGTQPGAGRIGRQIAEESMEAPKVAPNRGRTRPSVIGKKSQLHPNPPPCVENPTVSQPSETSGLSFGPIPSVTLNSNPSMAIISSPNHETGSLESSLLGVIDPDLMSSSTSEGANDSDEAAMAVIMSLLEADAGLGGPVDFSDLPWPL